jgi:hypothetical protein
MRNSNGQPHILLSGSNSKTEIHIEMDLVVGGFLPADDFSIMIRTNWIEAATILLRADQHGISPRFDADGQLTVSGYALYASGVIDAVLRPTTELTDSERRELGLNNPATVRAAMCLVMSNYYDWLRAALEHDYREDPRSIFASRLRNHLSAVARWLIENPLMDVPGQGG